MVLHDRADSLGDVGVRVNAPIPVTHRRCGQKLLELLLSGGDLRQLGGGQAGCERELVSVHDLSERGVARDDDRADAHTTCIDDPARLTRERVFVVDPIDSVAIFGAVRLTIGISARSVVVAYKRRTGIATPRKEHPRQISGILSIKPPHQRRNKFSFTVILSNFARDNWNLRCDRCNGRVPTRF